MSDNANFFNKNAKTYRAETLQEFDQYFIDFIDETKKNNFKMLDVGGGSGLFACNVKSKFPSSEISVVDPSIELLNLISNPDIKKFVGELPGKLKIDGFFNYIHIKEVLHHVTGRTVKESRNYVNNSLVTLSGLLDKKGYLMIHELYYEGHIKPTSTRGLIFFALNLQNKLGFRLPQKEFISGLSVCFYTREELHELVSDAGLTIIQEKTYPWNVDGELIFTMRNKLMLLKEWGRVVIICQRKT